MLKFLADWLSGVKAPAAGHSLSFRILLEDLEIGRLGREDDQWIFRYSEDFRRQTSIQPIMDFPNVEKEYRNAELWPFFLLRIPSLAQPSVQRMLERRKLETVDQGTLLQEFGRRSVANPFELVPA